jgi:hypothetical protein
VISPPKTDLNTMRRFIDEYFKHAALNLGQALQGIRYFHSHPDADKQAERGSARHLMLSCRMRAKRVVNDLFFAAIPPQWHHSRAELAQMTEISSALWFQYGYCAWRFDETGQPKPDLPPNVDRRWDPRCE